MPRPRKVSQEKRIWLGDIAAVRRSLPSNKQLAYELGVAERTIEQIMEREMERRADEELMRKAEVCVAEDCATIKESSTPDAVPAEQVCKAIATGISRRRPTFAQAAACSSKENPEIPTDDGQKTRK